LFPRASFYSFALGSANLKVVSITASTLFAALEGARESLCGLPSAPYINDAENWKLTTYFVKSKKVYF